MEGAEEELERRSRFLSSLIQKKKAIEQQEQHEGLNIRVRAADMPVALQHRAFRCARDTLDSMPKKLDSKRLALALKKEMNGDDTLPIEHQMHRDAINGFIQVAMKLSLMEFLFLPLYIVDTR
ncbi:uncharacterized protein LOC122081279 isoform X3 [Macadamia integrifolia]|uniref:uncharacterized protein LOC122081279 isoform X3 n=1 Tax=Macadamia integrifolia TaxID=60698 RepID=UPI001C4E4687|nr:uncharacterized protein LOC122081279 isoform X3 [Macadamia integrifolia]